MRRRVKCAVALVKKWSENGNEDALCEEMEYLVQLKGRTYLIREVSAVGADDG